MFHSGFYLPTVSELISTSTAENKKSQIVMKRLIKFL